MKKIFTAAVLCCLLAVTSAQALRVGALKGPTAMGLAKMMHDGGGGHTFTLAASPDALVPLLARGELDVALLPANLAAVLYQNMKGGIAALNVNTLGRLGVLERGDSVHGLSDLAGRTVYAAGRASTPEYALARLLLETGVEGVTVEWKGEHSEAASAFLSDPSSLAFLPEPFVSVVLLRAPDARVALDVGRLWEDAGLGTLVTGVTVAQRGVIGDQAEELRGFLALQKASQDYVLAHPQEAAAWMEELGILTADVAQKAIPQSGITYLDGDAMETTLEAFYAAMFEQNPASVGGMLPDAAFYAVP